MHSLQSLTLVEVRNLKQHPPRKDGVIANLGTAAVVAVAGVTLAPLQRRMMRMAGVMWLVPRMKHSVHLHKVVVQLLGGSRLHLTSTRTDNRNRIKRQLCAKHSHRTGHPPGQRLPT